MVCRRKIGRTIHTTNNGNWEDRVFNQGNFRLNFKSDNSLWGGNVRIEWSCTPEVPPEPTPTDAIGRLRQLLDLTRHFFKTQFPRTDWQLIYKANNWMDKFNYNSDRMEDSFRRCGEGDLDVAPEPEWESYDHSNHANAIDTLTTGFTKWTDIYIKNCKGQRTYQHQRKRMAKWNLRLKEILNDPPVWYGWGEKV
jgi:hypothetical protein